MVKNNQLFLKEVLENDFKDFSEKKKQFLPYVICDLFINLENNFVVDLCEHIKSLEAKAKKNTYDVNVANKLKGLVYDLVSNHIKDDDVIEKIKAFRLNNQDLERKVWKWKFIFPYKTKNKTTKLFDKYKSSDVGSQVESIKSNKCIDSKVYWFVNREYHRKFMKMLDERIKEQKQIVRKVSKRGLFTIISHWFSSKKRKSYNDRVANEEAMLTNLTEFKENHNKSTLLHIARQIGNIAGKGKIDVSSFFGNTEKGQALTAFCNDKLKIVKQVSSCNDVKKPINKISKNSKDVVPKEGKKTKKPVENQPKKLPKKKKIIMPTRKKIKTKKSFVKFFHDTAKECKKINENKKRRIEKRKREYLKKVQVQKKQKTIKSNNNIKRYMGLWHKPELTEKEYETLRLWVVRNQTSEGNELKMFTNAYEKKVSPFNGGSMYCKR